MKSNFTLFFKKIVFVIALLLTNYYSFSQSPTTPSTKSEFWQKVRFGIGGGLNFGNFTNISLAPSAIYQVNDQLSLGLGVQGGYTKSRDFFKSTTVGCSLIGLFNPIQSIQLSLEVEQLNVNRTILNVNPNLKDQFWNTAAFVGGGYQVGGVVIGGRYNLLFDQDKNIYGSAFMPFVRAFF
jgi:hypothetical protein